MISIKLNGEKYSCASSWEQIKFRQYIRILKEWDADVADFADRDYFKLLCILTDYDIKGKKADPEVFNQVSLMNAVGWVVYQPFEFSKELPDVLEIKGNKYLLPRDPSELSIGQNIHLRRDYIEKNKIEQENYAIATAIYLQPFIDGPKFDIKKAQALCKEIEEMPAFLIYPIGFFFTNRALNFGKPFTRQWHLLPANLKRKLKATLHGWQKRIGSTLTTTFR